MTTTGQGNAGAQGTGNQVNVFVNTPPGQRSAPPADAPLVAPGERPTGALPAVCNLGNRFVGFAGREAELARLREQLCAGGPKSVQALHGLGGVGKTQLALEYAHRNAADYDVIWWISAEQAGLIGEQFAGLGANLGLVNAEADSGATARAVKGHLRGQDRWLLIFDNAELPQDIAPWLPGGPGHVVITSRHQHWPQLAVPVPIDVLTRPESVQLLTSHHPMLDPTHADELAEALGDLPLALVQAAGLLAETGMSTGEYRELLTSEAGEVLAENAPLTYPRSLAAAIAVSTDRLAEIDPAALAILRLCAFLAPEPVPVELIAAIARFEAADDDGSWGLAALAAVIDKPLPLRRSLARLGNFGLAKLPAEGIVVHRLVQAILREQLPPSAARDLRTRIESVLGQSGPGDERDPTTWPGWARLLPHLLAANPASTTNTALRGLACRAIVFLIVRGDARPAQRLAEHLYQEWRETLGPDHPHALQAATELAWAYRDLGELYQLRPLVEDTLARQRDTLGPDHPDTLRSASDLAVVLSAHGHHAGALPIDEDVLARRQRVLGSDHPDTLISMSNLAGTLHSLGQYQQAQTMQQDVLTRRQRTLGDDHPDTLTAQSNLAYTLRSLGQYQQAHTFEEDVLTRRQRTLGDDHPDTLTAQSNLANTLRSLGQYQQAHTIEEDVLTRRQRTLGDDHPDTLTAKANLAHTLHSLGQYQQAHTMQQDVLTRSQRTLGDDHPATLTAKSNLAYTLRSLGQYQQAHTFEEDALARRQRALGDDHPDTLTAKANLAHTLRSLGRHEQAHTMQQDVFTRSQRTLGDDHPDTLTAKANLAHTLRSLGQYEGAGQLTEAVLTTRRRALGAKHPDTLICAVNHALTLWELHQRFGARRLAEEGVRGLQEVLGSQHPTTRWAREQLNQMKAAMGGGRSAKGGRRK